MPLLPENNTTYGNKILLFFGVFFYFIILCFVVREELLFTIRDVRTKRVYCEVISNISTPETTWETAFKSCQEDVKTELKQVLRWI